MTDISQISPVTFSESSQFLVVSTFQAIIYVLNLAGP